MSIKGAVVINHEILLSERNTDFTVDDEDVPNTRHLTDLYAGATGNRNVLLVRISTTDAKPSFSLSEWKETLFGTGPNIKTSFQACSFGQLKMFHTRSMDIQLKKPITVLDNGSKLSDAAIDVIMKQNPNIDSVGDLADHVMFATPPGTEGWIACK